MQGAIGSGFRELLNFSGRTSRGQFWPYCGVVLGLAFAANAALFTVVIGGAAASDDPNTFPSFTGLVWGVIVWGGAAIFLLAAAVTRRLHDTGRSGWWGLLPLPFVLAGLFLMMSFANQILEAEEPDMTHFAILFGNNVVYLAALGFLIYLLARSGEKQDNRFGPSPLPSPLP